MGWTAPRDWTVGEIITEAMMDTHVKDNLRYLKGLDGAVTLSDALILPDGAGKYIHIPILTTVERDALTPTAGMLIYNSTTTQFNKYENTAWRADLGFNSHHGDLSGLTDDDHTIYQKESLLTTAGDIAYATADSTWARLPIGTASQFLRVNGAATAPEWTSGAMPQYGIIVWTGTIANIPAGFVICDGNNSSPNLLLRFLEGVATAATDPGATGGATAKTTSAAPYSLIMTTSAAANVSTYNHTHSIADIRPLFYDVAFIMKS